MSDNDLSRDLAKIYDGLAMRAAATDDPAGRACYALILDMLPKIFEALDRFATPVDGEDDRLEKFIEVVFPRALAHCALFVLTSTTPDHFLADAAISITDEFEDVFMEFVSDVLAGRPVIEPPQ